MSSLHEDVLGGRGFGWEFQGSWCTVTWLELWKSKGTTKTLLDPFQKQLPSVIWDKQLRTHRVGFWSDSLGLLNSQQAVSKFWASCYISKRFYVVLCDPHHRLWCQASRTLSFQNPNSFLCHQWSHFGTMTWKANAWCCPTLICLQRFGCGGQEPC